MTNPEKEHTCHVFASLLLPPDRELIEQGMRGVLHSFFQGQVRSRGGERGLPAGLMLEGEIDSLMGELKNEYDRLFSGVCGEGVSLVESYHKPWTRDVLCPLPFASGRGLLMGDPAVHLLDVYRECGLEVAEEFRAFPDHLVMELEFLSYLYRWADDVQIGIFIKDHLDWIPLLKEELKKLHPHPFYNGLLEALDLFLKAEKDELEIGNHGEKSIH
jgi:TorA maturation chaperone TorD